MKGIVWDSISHVSYAAWSVAVLAALCISLNWMLTTLKNVTATLNAKRGKNSYTTTPIVNKHSGLETQPPPATYAVYPSSLETPSKQITLMQETQTHNYSQHTEGVTPAGVTNPHSNRYSIE